MGKTRTNREETGNVARLNQTLGLSEVTTKLTQVGDVVVSIIENPEPELSQRSLSRDILVSRMKSIVNHLTKGLDKKGEWTMPNSDLQVFIEYLGSEGKDIESMIRAIRGKNQMAFDEKLIRGIVDIVISNKLSPLTNLKVKQNKKVQNDKKKESPHMPVISDSSAILGPEDYFGKLGNDLVSLSEVIEKSHLNPTERAVVTNSLNTVINTYMKLMK